MPSPTKKFHTRDKIPGCTRSGVMVMDPSSLLSDWRAHACNRFSPLCSRKHSPSTILYPTLLLLPFPPPPPLLQPIERCYHRRSDSSARLYLLYSVWSECEAPHIAADEGLRIQRVINQPGRANISTGRRGGGGGREPPHLQSECGGVFILTWFMITEASSTPS